MQRTIVPAACLVAVSLACGTTPTENPAMGTGGASPGTGGAPLPSGGASGSGGTTISTGGLSSAGGSASTGGRPASGGGTSTGGSPAGGSAAGGTTGSGGSAAMMSEGCGTPTSLTSGSKTISVGGMERAYTLKIPDGYDPETPYRLIFGWHWRGGQMSDVVSGQIIGGPYYGLESRAEGSAIFVAPEGIDNGWANPQGRDINFLKAMLELFFADLCIDKTKLFSLGFSYGGMMSDAIACEMSDVFRAIAPMSGALYSGCNQTTDHPIAVWMAHGTNDDVVPLADGKAALDVFIERNGCTAQTSPVDPSPCVAYEGCAEGYPIHYCEFNGGHSPQNFAPDAVWDFFSQL